MPVRNAAWYHPATLNWPGDIRVQLTPGSGSSNHNVCSMIPRVRPIAAPTMLLTSCGLRFKSAHSTKKAASGSRIPSPYEDA